MITGLQVLHDVVNIIPIFVKFINYGFWLKVILTFICRFEGSGNSHGTCNSQCTVSGQIGTPCQMLPSRFKTACSASSS